LQAFVPISFALNLDRALNAPLPPQARRLGLDDQGNARQHSPGQNGLN